LLFPNRSNEIQAGRNKNQAGRNEIQIGRNEIQMSFLDNALIFQLIMRFEAESLSPAGPIGQPLADRCAR
jgi:hypothetical protein